MKNKKYALMIIATLLFNVCANAQSYIWAKNPKSSDNDFSNAVATDYSGNSYITGYYHGATIIFGSATLTNTGGFDPWLNPCTDIFVAKYNSSGGVEWAKSYGVTNGMEQAQGIVADHDGNTYITGWYASAPFVLGGITLATHGNWDIFLTKLDVNGNVVWAKGIGGSSDDVGYGVALSDSGYVYLAGYYKSSSINIGGITLSGAGGFVAKYDTSGNVVWAKKAGNDVVADVDASSSGNVYITGKYTGTINLGGITLPSSGGNDVFVAKYSPSGTVLWAKKGGGPGHDYASGISIDNQGNVYATGFYRGTTITFGTTVLPNTSTAHADDADVYIVKYNSAGTIGWAKCGNGNDWDQSTGISTDNNGSLYLTGYYLSDTIFFADSVAINYATTYVTPDIFIVKYDTNGNVNWIDGLGEPYEEKSSGIIADNSNNVFFTGMFNDPTFTIGPSTMMNSGQMNPFIAKMGILLDIEEFPDQNSIGVFPNPSEGEFHLNINILANQKININVFSLSGQLMMKESKELSKGNNPITIDLNGFSKGIYLLEVSSNKLLYHKKLVVQ